MLDTQTIQFCSYLHKIADSGVDEVILSHNGRIIIQQLLKTDIVAWLYGYGIHTVIITTLVGSEVKLILTLNRFQGITLTTYTLAEENVVRQLVMKLDKDTVLVVDDTFVEVSVRQTEFACLAFVTTLY